jgi:hypothetical protein
MPTRVVYVLPLELTDDHLVLRVQYRVKMDNRTINQRMHATHRREQEKHRVHIHRHPRTTDYPNEIEQDENGVRLNYCLSKEASMRAWQEQKMREKRQFVLTIFWDDCPALRHIKRLLDSLSTYSPKARGASRAGRCDVTGAHCTAKRERLVAKTIRKSPVFFRRGFKSPFD